MTPTFTGTRRFKVLRKLGEGGMGVVYECQDVDLGTRVALKTLLFSNAGSLLRFKDEFRQFQGIHHPNLVSLGELFEEDGQWHFTMELVRGADFLSHVRPSQRRRDGGAMAAAVTLTEGAGGAEGLTSVIVGHGAGAYDEEALRSALGQLARGLTALHDAGKVHRDVKPSNILVTVEGRTVLLDFGVATDAARITQLDGGDTIVGTPHYMAPEQAAAMPVGAAADWYAVGAMLYEILTGQLPFEGPLLQVIADKQRRVPRHPSELARGVPPDLADLALDLLMTDPARRPSGVEVIHRIDARSPMPPPSSAGVPISVVRSDTQTSVLVGRDAELDALKVCFRRVKDERGAVAAYVYGQSGIGKSALVARFTDEVRATNGDAVVLSGACYEHEAVPYKAVDGVVDALSKYLVKLSPDAAAALLPRHAAALAQAFPVLGRVEAFAERSRERADLDPLERRSRVFGALRELLHRLSQRGPLILCIDDLQWADPDSIALLGDILSPPDSPQLLLVATLRAEDPDAPLALPTGPVALPPGGVTLRVAKLSEEHARELARSLARKMGADATIDVERIVSEAQGYPLFLHELVRYHASQPIGATSKVGLEDALWSRISALDDAAKRMLQVTALAPAAIMQGTATRAAGIDPSEAVKCIRQLKVANLARTTGGTRATDTVEPYHALVRDAVRSRLAPAAKRALHRRIALAMETGGVQEPEQLAIHWREAGEVERAAEAAERAAARAEDALAFDRAARYYRMLDELVERPPKSRRALLVKLGDALANAGRSQEAASVFREAARGAATSEARELARKATEHLLRSGHIGDGIVELRRVLDAAGLSYPETTGAAVTSLLWSRAKLALRGLSFVPVDESDVSPSLLTQIDACWAATAGLFVVDQLRGVDFHYRHLLLALSSGEPTRVIRGLAFHAIATQTGGFKHRAEATKLVQSAQSYAERHGTAYSRALVTLSDGTVAYLGGSFAASIDRGQRAIELLRSTCRGVAWELATARQLVFWSLALTGRLDELSRLTRSNLRETVESGDQYAAMSIRSGLPNVVWLAQDDPAGARKEADEAIAAWASGDAFLQHLMDLVAQVGIDLYEGDADGAFARVEAQRRKLEAAGLTRVELNRVLLLEVASRAAVAAAATRGPRDRGPLLEAARRDAAALGREAVPWARALGELRSAAIASLEGSPDARALAQRAVIALTDADLRLFAACAAHAAGLDGAAESLLVRERVQSPATFARAFAPGFVRAVSRT